MKSIFLLISCCLSIVDSAFSQDDCPCENKIQSPVVAKPADAGLVASTCSTLVVKWKGTAGQTYLVSGTYKDATTGQTLALSPASDFTHDKDGNYTATIPVVAGSRVSWNVEAMKVQDDRTFYSYPLRGGQDYVIPSCDKLTTSTAKKPKSLEANKTETAKAVNAEVLKLEVYPNPVESVLHLKLPDTAKEETIRIVDVNGRVVLSRAATRRQINVSQLKTGSYLLRVEDAQGRVIYNTRFIKQ